MPIRVRLFLTIFALVIIPLVIMLFFIPGFPHIIFTSGGAAFLSIFFLAIISVTLASLFFAVQFTLPLTELRELAREVQHGRFDQRAIVRDQDEIGDLGTSFNIMLDSLQKQHEKEVALDKAKDEFLSIAAHQLRTPLGEIRWNMELLDKGSFGKLPAKTQKVITDMHESTIRFIGLVNDLLDVSRINQGKTINKPEKIHADVLIQQVVEDIAFDAGKKSIKIQVDNKAETAMTVADPKLFIQVVQNVLSNALQYSRDNSTIEVTITKKAKYIEVAIADKGIGIPKKDQEKIYEKFFRANNAAESPYSGTGLGLFVVKSYMESMKGAVRFESEVGKGTTFYLTFPAL